MNVKQRRSRWDGQYGSHSLLSSAVAPNYLLTATTSHMRRTTPSKRRHVDRILWYKALVPQTKLYFFLLYFVFFKDNHRNFLKVSIETLVLQRNKY